MDSKIVFVFQVILSVILVGLILLQSKGTGLGSAFGGNSFYGTKRGAEKLLFTLTIAIATLFLLSSMVLVLK